MGTLGKIVLVATFLIAGSIFAADKSPDFTKLQSGMSRLQTMMNQINTTNNPKKKADLYNEHFQAMQAQMGLMSSLMGSMGPGMMNGYGRGYGRGTMMGAGGPNGVGPGQNWGQMQAYMAQMIGQMQAHQAECAQAIGGTKK